MIFINHKTMHTILLLYSVHLVKKYAYNFVLFSFGSIMKEQEIVFIKI